MSTIAEPAPATRSPMTAEDRWGIYDLFGRYAWAYDCGDAAAYAATFTADGVVEGMDGTRVTGRAAIGAFVQHYIDQRVPGEGWQHHTGHLQFVEEGGDACTVYCYWAVAETHIVPGSTFALPDGKGVVRSSGYYLSRCVKEGGTWSFRERVIRYWTGKGMPWTTD
jgi:uncharacterized protein (TIGR02246 family)